MKAMTVLTNPLREGDEIPWETEDYVFVEIVPGAAEQLKQMALDGKAFDYGAGPGFAGEALPLLMPSLTEENETLVQLMACTEDLIATTETADGRYQLKIVEWDGTEYTRTVASLPQDDFSFFNEIHSWNSDIEISYDNEEYIMEGYIHRAENGVWQIAAVNNGSEILCIHEHQIFDSAWGGGCQCNDSVYYGTPMFNTELTTFDLSALPVDMAEMLEQLDTSKSVCTAHDDTALYTEPDGEIFALCYTRVPGLIVSETDGWVEMQLGSSRGRVNVWVRAEDLAYGIEMEDIICTFPSYDEFLGEEDALYALKALDGSIIMTDGYVGDIWLVGKLPDGRWLVLLYGEGDSIVCTASEDAFTQIRPTEHWCEKYWDDE